MEEIKRFLAGRKVRFAVVPIPPYSIPETYSNRTVVLGTFGKIVHTILDHLQLDYKVLVVESTGVKGFNGSWTGIMGMLLRQEIDVSMPLQVTGDRYQAIHQTNPVMFSPLTFVTKAPGRLINIYTVYKPFTVALWSLVLVSLIVTGLVLTLLDETATHASYRRRVPRRRYRWLRRKTMKKRKVRCKIYWAGWNCLFRFGDTFMRRTITPAGFFPGRRSVSGERPLGVCWAFLLLIVANGYTTSLISRLTSPVMEPTVDTLVQLINSINRGLLKAGSLTSTTYAYLLPWLSFRANLHLKNMEDAKSSSKDFDKGMERVLAGGYAFITARLTLEMYMSDYGQEFFHLAEDDLLSIELGLAFPKKSVLAPIFSRLSRWFFDMGLTNFWLEQDRRLIHYGKTQESLEGRSQHREPFHQTALLSKVADGSAVPLNMQTTIGVFVMLALGMGASLISFCLEQLIFHYKRTSFLTKRLESKLYAWTIVKYWKNK